MENRRLTNLSPSELEDFFLLEPRVFSDYRHPISGKFAIVYNFSETTDNEISGFRKVVELAQTRSMNQLGICSGSTECGYAGFDHSMRRLQALGLGQIVSPRAGSEPSATRVEAIHVQGNVNTGSEAEALVRYGASLGGDIGIVAPAFHLVRAFTTTVSAMVRLDKMQRVYAIAGAPLPWTESVRHSQGTLENTRADLLADELKRLEKYRAEEYGSMLNAKSVLEYLNWRDRK